MRSNNHHEHQLINLPPETATVSEYMRCPLNIALARNKSNQFINRVMIIIANLLRTVVVFVLRGRLIALNFN